MDFRQTRKGLLSAYAGHYIGDVLASVMVVKHAADAPAGTESALFGSEEAMALDKGLGRLGWGYGTDDTRVWFGLVLAPSGRPALDAKQLRMICEIVDPLTIVTLDADANRALEAAFAMPTAATSATASVSTTTATSATTHTTTTSATPTAATPKNTRTTAQLPHKKRVPGTDGQELLGRRVVHVDGFAQALQSEAEKQRVWAELKLAAYPTP